MPIKDSKLLRIVSDFRRGILGNEPSDMMCFAVCYPLQGYLAMLGYDTELVEADFGRTNHVWLQLSDGRIIDPTADQFSWPMLKRPKVYIGPIPDIYTRWIERGQPTSLASTSILDTAQLPVLAGDPSDSASVNSQ